MKRMLNIIFLFIFVIYGYAYGAEKIGKVEEIKGTAEAFRTEGIIKLNINDPIFEKDTLRTRANSLLKVKFNDGKVIILTEKTKFTIDSYSKDKEFNTIRGGIRSIVEKLGKDESFKIKTTTAVAGIRGTDFAVLLFGEEMSVYVFSGTVNVQNPYGSVDVNKGFHTITMFNQPPQPPVQTPDYRTNEILQLFSLTEQFNLKKIKDESPVVQSEQEGIKTNTPIGTSLPPNIPPSETNPKTLQPGQMQDYPYVPPYQP